MFFAIAIFLCLSPVKTVVDNNKKIAEEQTKEMRQQYFDMAEKSSMDLDVLRVK